MAKAKANPLPPLELLRELFFYPSPEGKLYWLKPRTNRLEPFDEAGTLDRHYLMVKVAYKKYAVQRIVWAMRNGRDIPEGYELDHKDRNKLNNRIDNLRLATPSQNQSNRAKGKNNTSGFKGVSWHKNEQMYYVQIRHKNKQYHLGAYRTAIEGAVAYNEAAKRLHGEFACLNEIPETPRLGRPLGEQLTLFDSPKEKAQTWGMGFLSNT